MFRIVRSLLPGCALLVGACGASAPPAWEAVARQVQAPGLVERFLEATHALIGTPYENGPLGEGDAGGPDPDPRVDFDRVDCVTFLEEALAVALTPEPDGPFLENLDRIRYEGGRVEFAARNHYMTTDWIPANDWLVEDVTETVAPGNTAVVTRTIDRAEFLRGHGVVPRPGRDDVRIHRLVYVPTASLPAAAPAIRPGDLVFWVGRAEGIFIMHTGLAVRDEDGALQFRHGSSAAGRVLDEPFAEYADRAGFALGFVVLRLREDALQRLAEARGTSGEGAGS